MCPRGPYKKGDRRRNAAKMAVLIPAAMVVLALASPYFLYIRCTETKSAERKKNKKIDDRGRSPPELVKRPRALSIYNESIPDQQNETGQKMTLLELPTEIRSLIFEYLVEPQADIYIHYSFTGLLYSTRCACRIGPGAVPEYERCGCHYHVLRGENRGGRPKTSVLAYLMTSRKIYRESINLLYTTSRFVFSDFTSFVAFSGSLVPSRFNAIRDLAFERGPTQTLHTWTVYGGPLEWTLDPSLAHYHLLHDYNFKLRCPILPMLPAYNVPRHKLQYTPPERDPWTVMLGIAKHMAGLKEVRLAMYLSKTDYLQCINHEDCQQWAAEKMWAEVEDASKTFTSETWKDWRQISDVRVSDDAERRACAGSIVLHKGSQPLAYTSK